MPLSVPPDLTVAQKAIWLEQQLFSGSPLYNTGQAVTIRGQLRIDVFARALRETVAHSPGLQLSAQAAPIDFELPLLDLRREPDPLAAAEAWMRAELRVPLALEDPALFRFALLRVGEELTLWFQKYHHIIIDATGRRLLSARTAERYRALRFGIPLPAVPFATPAAVLQAERGYAASDSHAVDRAYWLTRFAAPPEPLLGGERRASERGRSGCQARIAFALSRGDFVQLERAAQALGSTAPRAIIALTYAAFAHLYDRADMVFGVELAMRSGAAARNMVGMLARPLALPLKFEPSLSIADLMRRLDKDQKRDYAHRRFPLQELVTALGMTRQGRHGLFDVTVNFVPAVYDFAFEDTPVELSNLSYGFASPWMVTIADTGLMRDLAVTIDTDPGLIDAATAARLAECLASLLTRGLQDPACIISRLTLMPDAVQEQILALGAGAAVELAAAETLATLCEAQAERTPNAVALRCASHELSFATLHARAARLARHLAARGVRPGVVVGIALPRTAALVIAVLAVHKAGGAYLALDPTYPAERIAYMVRDSAAPIILTDVALATLFADSGAQLVFDIDALGAIAAEAEPVAPRASDLAYVLYTSGSTGRPKAVGIEHRQIINLVSWGRSIISDAELGAMLFSTSLNFDLSAFELFVPLAFGGCILMVENLLALQSAPGRERVRLINTGPSLMRALLRTGGVPPGVSTILLAGERLCRALADQLFDTVPGVRVFNCYGPTETTVYSSCARVAPGVRSEPAIGRPIWNTSLQVRNANASLLPCGAAGELFIGGAGVARGYLGQPALDAERFIPNPHGAGRLYRTGDRVRWGADGELEFLGRTDEQMKINGVRIEGGEIEAALMSLPGISAAAVKLHEDSEGIPRLTAYLVPDCDTVPHADRVSEALARRLPRYMVPNRWVWLRAMPMAPNGKLERGALLPPPPARDRAADDRPPETELEREIAGIWARVLGASPPGVQSDFYDLGGDSLALLNLFGALEARYGRRFTVDVLTGGLTIAKLQRLLGEEEVRAPPANQIVALQPHGYLPPFFCVPGIGGDLLQLHRLGLHMGAERPFFGIRWSPEVRANDDVGQIAARYVAAMRVLQPTGPYYLGGYCLGAIVAYEMAQQLKQQGQRIGLLVVIEQRASTWRPSVRGALPALYHSLGNALNLLRDDWSPFELGRQLSRKIGLRMVNGFRAGSRSQAAAEAAFALGRLLQEQALAPGEAHLQALRRHRLLPTGVPVSLFRATAPSLRNLPLDRTLGWRHLSGDVTVRKIAGDHISITTEPRVRQLAQALSDALDSAQEVPHRSAHAVASYPMGQRVRV